MSTEGYGDVNWHFCRFLGRSWPWGRAFWQEGYAVRAQIGREQAPWAPLNAEHALELAVLQHNTTMARALAYQIQLYQAAKPLREMPGGTATRARACGYSERG